MPLNYLHRMEPGHDSRRHSLVEPFPSYPSLNPGKGNSCNPQIQLSGLTDLLSSALLRPYMLGRYARNALR